MELFAFSQGWGLCEGWQLAVVPSLPPHLEVAPAADPGLVMLKSIPPMLRDLILAAAAQQGGEILQKEDACARKVLIVYP